MDTSLELSDGFILSGLGIRQLELRYLTLGGHGTLEELLGHIDGSVCPDEHDHNVIAQALNEAFLEQGQDPAVAYRNLFRLDDRASTAAGAEVLLRQQHGSSVVVVSGEMDAAVLPTLWSALVEACMDTPSHVYVDFDEVTFCGADTLGLLATTAARLRASGRQLVIRGVRPRQVQIFHLCGLEHLLGE
jgi:anti-anti-sigma factor